MYIQMTVVKIEPKYMGEVVDAIDRRARQTNWQEIRGLRHSLVIESVDEPGRLIWFSTWEALGDAQVFFTGATYAGWVGAIRTYLLAGPAWYGYHLLADLSNHSKEY